jgi:hypothetical protein
VCIFQAKGVSDITLRASCLYFKASHWKGQLNQSKNLVSLTLYPFHHYKGQLNLSKDQPLFYFIFLHWSMGGMGGIHLTRRTSDPTENLALMARQVSMKPSK